MSNRNTGVSNGQLMSRNVLELSGGARFRAPSVGDQWTLYNEDPWSRRPPMERWSRFFRKLRESVFRLAGPA